MIIRTASAIRIIVKLMFHVLVRIFGPLQFMSGRPNNYWSFQFIPFSSLNYFDFQIGFVADAVPQWHNCIDAEQKAMFQSHEKFGSETSPSR